MQSRCGRCKPRGAFTVHIRGARSREMNQFEPAIPDLVKPPLVNVSEPDASGAVLEEVTLDAAGGHAILGHVTHQPPMSSLDDVAAFGANPEIALPVGMHAGDARVR